jgi:hypothetical protein
LDAIGAAFAAFFFAGALRAAFFALRAMCIPLFKGCRAFNSTTGDGFGLLMDPSPRRR